MSTCESVSTLSVAAVALSKTTPETEASSNVDLEGDASTGERSLEALTITMIQCTGLVEGEFSSSELFEFCTQGEGVQNELWKPGKLGVRVENPETEPVGSWHLKTRVFGIVVSMILFRTGGFKLSMGRGLQAFGCRASEIEETCANVMYKIARRRLRNIKTNLISGSKFFGSIECTLRLAKFLESEHVYPVLRYPHYHEAGRINVVRAYISGCKRANIAIDHGGWAHFTGFSSVDDMEAAKDEFDVLLRRFRFVLPSMLKTNARSSTV